MRERISQFAAIAVVLTAGIVQAQAPGRQVVIEGTIAALQGNTFTVQGARQWHVTVAPGADVSDMSRSIGAAGLQNGMQVRAFGQADASGNVVVNRVVVVDKYVTGTVSDVSASGFVVNTREGARRVAVPAGVGIEVGGRVDAGARLQNGMTVRVLGDQEQGVVVARRIILEQSYAVGTVSGVQGNTFTLATNRGPQRVTVAPGAHIQGGSLASLQNGMQVRVLGDLEPGSILATSVTVLESYVAGTVTNLNGSTFTLATAQGPRVVRLGPSTQVSVKTAGSALQNGMHAQVWGDAINGGELVATRIVAYTPYSSASRRK